MTSHLTTHRKPKPDKSFRAHFSSEIEEYNNNEAGILSGEYTTKPNVKNFRAFEQSKQLNAQNIGSNHYVLGDMQNIEVHTAAENSDQQNVNLEHGLGLLSSVARKGDTTDVQVDGIVNIPESQFSAASSSNNVDQVVEVLIRNSAEDKSNQGSTLSVQMPAGNSQNKIILDPSTQAVTDADGQEIPLDSNTANNLANILQNPDVLAAINNAASTNKLIVIGPVSMFDGSTSQSSSVVALSSAENSIDGNVSTTFSQEQLAQISAMVQQEQSNGQVSSQSVNDSISATSALAAVESYLQSEQPSSSINVKGDEVVGNILGSIQPDGKRGPSAVVQSAQAVRAANNLTISMPPMTQSSLSITQASLGMDVSNKLPVMKSLELQSTSSEEVTSSNDVNSQGEPDGQITEAGQSNIDDEQQLVIHQEQAESTTHPPEEFMIASNDLAHAQYIATDQNVVADSSDMVDTEASSSGEPVLLLSTDENGQPQIIVKMPDGSETIMSDPALAESLIQVPTITNAGIEGNEAEAAAMVEQLPNTIQLQMPDQGVPDSEEPSQSGMAQSQFASQSHQISGEVDQLPDQGLSSESTIEADGGSVDSSCSVRLVESNETTQQSVVSNSTSIVVQTPDSSSSQSVSESQIDSRQGLFVMEHISASDEQSGYPEQSNIDFPPDQQSSEFQADSSSGAGNGDEAIIESEEVVDGNVIVESTYLQMNDVSQSTNVSNLDIVTTAEPGTVSSTDNSEE